MGRFGREKDALWSMVSTARYNLQDIGGCALGENVEKLGLQVVKAWWRLGKGGRRVGIIYRDKLRSLVEKETELFWTDLWLGKRCLSVEDSNVS